MFRTEQLRAFLLEHLKNATNRRGELQFAHCLKAVEHIAEQRCPDEFSNGTGFRQEDGARLKHVIWDLILERVLVPSTANPRSLNDGWPFLSITDHGQKVIEEQRPVPYDPDGYLARLHQNTGGLHGTVTAYLSEALTTFRTGNTMASAVMLGAASEMLFVELCESIGDSLAAPNEQSAFRDKTGQRKKMVQRVQAVSGWLSQKRSQLPEEWKSTERHQLVQKIADLIRKRRNDTGHPQDPPERPSHEEMYALLMIFPDYCEKLYSLKNWLLSRRGTHRSTGNFGFGQQSSTMKAKSSMCLCTSANLVHWKARRACRSWRPASSSACRWRLSLLSLTPFGIDFGYRHISGRRGHDRNSSQAVFVGAGTNSGGGSRLRTGCRVPPRQSPPQSRKCAAGARGRSDALQTKQSGVLPVHAC